VDSIFIPINFLQKLVEARISEVDAQEGDPGHFFLLHVLSHFERVKLIHPANSPAESRSVHCIDCWFAGADALKQKKELVQRKSTYEKQIAYLEKVSCITSACLDFSSNWL
jgi:hypothetical protein